MRTRRTIAALAAIILGTVAAQAQTYDLSWHSLDGGGHMFSTGGVYSLGGTIGQPDAGVPMTGGTFSLVGGFWAGAQGPSTPCPADLTGDGKIDQADLGLLLSVYGLCPGNPGYLPQAGNLGGDPCVGQADLGALLAVYGTNCP